MTGLYLLYDTEGIAGPAVPKSRIFIGLHIALFCLPIGHVLHCLNWARCDRLHENETEKSRPTHRWPFLLELRWITQYRMMLNKMCAVVLQQAYSTVKVNVTLPSVCLFNDVALYSQGGTDRNACRIYCCAVTCGKNVSVLSIA